MIQANELRIGNWVKSGIEYQIKASDFINTDFEKICPILLSELVLEKCGFEKESFEGSWSNGNFLIGYITTDEHLQMEYMLPFVSGWQTIDLRYLHELQNLYFALTGQELQYTP